jgi:hypothetical protein
MGHDAKPSGDGYDFDQLVHMQIAFCGLDHKLETLKIETHCSERRFGRQVPEFSGWNFGLQWRDEY